MPGLTVLCVDPDERARDATGTALTDEGYDVRASKSVEDALATLDGEVDCIVTEYSLPGGTGLDLADRVRERQPDLPCVLFTNASPDRIETENREGVVVEYLPRDMPDALSSLARLVDNVVSQRSQVGYPLPPDEDERLAALDQYDRPGMEAAEAFDRLSTLAKSHFGVDVAFLGLVDAHEERVLACSGADWETMSREDTMCTHTILEDEMLVVEDVSADPRFAGNERLAELDIEAYAGVPLRTPAGTPIGAFCVIHDEPRTFSDAGLANLQLFAAEVMDQLELRRRLVEAETGESTPPEEGAASSVDGTGGTTEGEDT